MLRICEINRIILLKFQLKFKNIEENNINFKLFL